MSNPYASPQHESFEVPTDDFQIPKGLIPSGMVQQVRVVAILNAVQGLLELMLAAVLISMAVFMPLMMNSDPNFQRQMADQPNAGSEEMFMYIWIGYGIVGFVLLCLGVLRIFAGFRNWSFRGRMLGITSVSVGLLSALLFYCAPTGIGILIYTLVVYLNPSVAQAFELGKQGAPGDRILFEFSPYRHADGMKHA